MLLIYHKWENYFSNC